MLCVLKRIVSVRRFIWVPKNIGFCWVIREILWGKYLFTPSYLVIYRSFRIPCSISSPTHISSWTFMTIVIDTYSKTVDGRFSFKMKVIEPTDSVSNGFSFLALILNHFPRAYAFWRLMKTSMQTETLLVMSNFSFYYCCKFYSSSYRVSSVTLFLFDNRHPKFTRHSR